MKPELVGYREFVAEQMGIWKVPGVAIAVVKNGEVALAEGFGLRNVEANLPVTPDTIFAIGSASKAFTTMSMGILVDDGRLAWDNPVRDYLPDFPAVGPVCHGAHDAPRPGDPPFGAAAPRPDVVQQPPVAPGAV